MSSLFASEKVEQVLIDEENWISLKIGGSVEVIDNLVSEFKRLQDKGNSDIGGAVIAIKTLVVGWNFKDENGNPMDFNELNILKLKHSSLNVIVDKMAENNEDLKQLLAKGKEAQAEVVDKKKEDTPS